MSGRDDLPKVSEILKMERKDLQSLSKAHGLPANLKKDELIEQLVELAKSKRKKKDKNEEIEEKEKRKKKRKNSEITSEEEEVSKKRKKVKQQQQEDKPKKRKHKKVEDMELDLEETPNQDSDEDFAPRSVKKTGKGEWRASEKAAKISDKKRNEEKKEHTGKRKKEKEEESSEVLEKKEKRSKEKERKSKNEKEVDYEKSKTEKEGSDDEKGSRGKSEVEKKGEKARKSKMELEVDKGRKSKIEKPVKSDKEGQEKGKDDNADKGRKTNNDRVTKNEKGLQEKDKDDINEKSRKSKNEKEGAESQGLKSKNDSEKKSEISSTKDKKPEIRDEKKKDTDLEDTLKKDTPRETDKKKDTPRETDKRKETPRETDKRKEFPQETSKKQDIPRETDKRKDTIPKEPEKKKDTLPQETDKKKDEGEKKMTDKVKSNEIANVVTNDKNEKPALQKSTPSETNKKITLETNKDSTKGITNTTIESPLPKYPLYNTVISYGKILAVLYEQFCISSRCIQFMNEITGRFLCKISKSISMIDELSMDILKDTLKKAFIEGDLLEEMVTEIQNSDQRYNDPKYFSFPLQNRAGLLLDLDQMHQFLVSFKVEVPRKVEICLGVIMECMITRIFIKSLPKPLKKGFLLTENHVRSSIQSDTTLSRIFKEFLEEVKPFNESLPIREYLLDRKLKPDPPPAEELARLKSKLGYSIPSSLETLLKFLDGKIELGVDPCQKIEANLESRQFLNDIFQMVGWLPIFTPSVDIITCLDIDSGYVLQLDILHLNTSFVKVISKNLLQYIQTIEKHVKPEQGTPIASHDPIIVQLLNPVLSKT